MTTYQSGAFLQQCFSVHPLSLGVKVVALPNLVGIVCQNCRLRHRLTLHPTSDWNQRENSETVASMIEELYSCSQRHLEDVRIASVDVVKGCVEVRCRPCRRTYRLDIRLFETHQSS